MVCNLLWLAELIGGVTYCGECALISIIVSNTCVHNKLIKYALGGIFRSGIVVIIAIFTVAVGNSGLYDFGGCSELYSLQLEIHVVALIITGVDV